MKRNPSLKSRDRQAPGQRFGGLSLPVLAGPGVLRYRLMESDVSTLAAAL